MADLDALVANARRGDRAALGGLLDGLAPRLYRLAASRLGAGPDAEDATQEALVRIARSVNGFRGQSSVVTWACRIALSAASDQRAGRVRRAKIVELALAREGSPAPVQPGEDLTRKERSEQVQQAVAGLPEHEREVVVLRMWEGLSFAEVADVLDCPVSTAHSRMVAALGKLRGRLGSLGDDR